MQTSSCSKKVTNFWKIVVAAERKSTIVSFVSFENSESSDEYGNDGDSVIWTILKTNDIS